MASRVPIGPYTEADLRELAGAASSADSPLPQIHVVSEGDPPFRALCFLLRVRSGGFMVAAPLLPQVDPFFQEEGLAEEDRLFASTQAEVQMETTRGRAVGQVPVLLVDVPWEYSSFFTRAPALRGEAARQLLRFQHQGGVVRPTKAALIEAANAWVTSHMDEDTAGDYASAESGADMPPLIPVEEDGHVEQLQQRIAELEAELAVRPRVPAGAPERATSRPAPMLGGTPTAAADPHVMEKLRMLAGGAPTRLGQHEKQSRLASPNLAADNAQQERQLGATEDEELEEAIVASLAEMQDPVHRLVALQMKQNALLSKQLQGKQQTDPLAAVLMPHTETGSSSSSGMKGCLARDAYVRVMNDLHKVAQVAEENALAELGWDSGGATPGLMREYVERRMPLGDLRQMTQFAYLMAAAWESGHRLQNRELQAWAVKALLYVEQSAIDNGRTQMGWLLTGQAEPNYQICQRNKARAGLRLFARLAAPAWISANVSYMRDLDFIEQKLKAAGPTKEVKEEEKEKDKPPRKFPPKKNKGQGKGEDSTTIAAA